MNKNYAIAVFAGGQSRRMKRDKAQLEWNGASLLEKICASAVCVTHRVLVVGRERPADWHLDDVRFFRDEKPQLGPIGALQTALHRALDEKIAGVLAVACDTPLIDEHALRWLMQQAETRDLFHGLTTTRDGEIEPLFSVYSVSCLPLLHRQMEENRRSMHGLIECGDFEYLEMQPEIASQLLNINTPDDWARLQTTHRVLDIAETL